MDFNFMLLRFWTLFDSINNTNYTVAKLGLWKEPGQKELREFFAQIGVPLDQAKQKFSYMDPDTKKIMQEKILEKM